MNSLRKNALSAKMALVTGGSRGVGAAIVRRLAADRVSVAFTCSSSEDKAHALVQEIVEVGGKAIEIKADSTSESEIRAAVQTVKDALKNLNIFISNAGVALLGEISNLKTEDLDSMINVNVRAAVIGIQASASVMNDGDRIITTGSVSGLSTGIAGASIYGMTKAALIGLVRGVPIDLAPRSITVNNIQPGPTATDMHPADSPYTEILTSRIPLRRFGKDEEIASLVACLVSDEAAFITKTWLEYSKKNRLPLRN